MENITFKNYIKGIKDKYEEERKGVFSIYLDKPSPALLHNYCKILKQNGLSKKDQDIIQLFYSLPNFDNDKFRPICNFFNEKTTNPSQEILDVMALLVDFKPRPLGDFLKGCGVSKVKDEELTEENLLIEEKKRITISKEFIEIPMIKKGICIKKNFILALIVVFLGLFTFVYLNYKKNKPCLEWHNDRFVEVDCNSEVIGFAGLDSKLPYNEDLLLLRKIIPTDTTTYFKNGKAIVWYCKIDENHLELFNAPGHHPITNKPLKAITDYMIEKYLKR